MNCACCFYRFLKGQLLTGLRPGRRHNGSCGGLPDVLTRQAAGNNAGVDTGLTATRAGRDTASASSTSTMQARSVRPEPLSALLLCISRVVCLLCLGFALQAQAASTIRINVDSSGNESNERSYSPQTSTDGRWVVFTSAASNLVPNDTNGMVDVFLHDRKSGNTRRVSVASNGSQGNERSFVRSVSANGRWVAFASYASNLVPGDTNGVLDIFVHDRVTLATERVSVADDGSQSNGISEDASLSGDGRRVAFRSIADNLVPGDSNEREDVFIRDRISGRTLRASVASGGGEADGDSRAPSLNSSGNLVAFQSRARNLVAGDTNLASDIFVHNLISSTTVRVSLADGGGEADDNSTAPSLSGNGQRVAFVSSAGNLVADDFNARADVFVRDRPQGKTQRASVHSNGSEANGDSSGAVISADGRRVAFESTASSLVDDDSNGALDVFLHDLAAATTVRVSVDSTGQQANNLSEWPGVDQGGRRIAFHSVANNLVADDTNRTRDIFLHDRGADCDVSASQHRFLLPPNQWITLSLPCEPPPGTRITDLFGDDIPGDYAENSQSETATWVVYTYDSASATPRYVNPGSQGELAMGQGFWIIQRTAANVTLDLPEGSRGLATDFAARSACRGSAGCISTALSGSPSIGADQAWWNLAGNPFNVAVPHDGLRVTTSSGACSGAGCSLNQAYAQPMGSRVVYDNLFYFNGSTYLSLKAGSNIAPWQGFWIGELAGASSASPELHFPENH